MDELVDRSTGGVCGGARVGVRCEDEAFEDEWEEPKRGGVVVWVGREFLG